MECFRNKSDGKLYGKIDGKYFPLFYFSDDEIESEDSYAVYEHSHIINHTHTSVNAILDAEYSLGDILTVPIDGKPVQFRVEHIQDVGDSVNVYFVAKDIYCKCSMDNIKKKLAEIESKMPKDFVGSLRTIKHKSKDGKYKIESKINLVSKANLGKEGYDCGEDDIPFDGLLTEADRCKNYNGETDWWWTCSPNLSSSAYFYYVAYYGGAGYSNSASGVIGVVPSFSFNLKKKNNH